MLRADPDLEHGHRLALHLATATATATGPRRSRRIGIRIFSGVLSLVAGRPVTDPTSGFRMTDRRGIELFARDYPHDYPEVEAVLMLHAHRLERDEMPVTMRAAPRAARRRSARRSRSTT